jgi:methylated-DNA-[protein]-cysteine S-methyltransferase
MEEAMVHFQETCLGRIGISEEGGSISHLFLGGDSVPREMDQGQTPLLREAFQQLERYLAGELTEFSLPLMPAGTPFMQRVWQELRRVPYGRTVSYRDIATALGNPKAVRAVGMANNRNPIPIFIPCHRIIGSSGKLVGYRGGLELKRRLLELERLGALSQG